MRRAWSLLYPALAAVLATFVITGASAQPTPAAKEPPPAPAGDAEKAPESGAKSPTDAELEQAKTLFRQGNELRKAGDFHKALELYQRSRAIVPSVPNTLNAAFCLERLERYDEALELYEELLTKFADKLGPDDRQSIASSTAVIRPKVGNVEVSATVTGIVVIDTRQRGQLPLGAPIRVLPGEHVVRVIKDGYATFERRFTVKAGETVPIDARLEPLAQAGRLRVDDPSLVGADLYVDNAVVGQLPWEGTLAPGQHLFWVRKDDVGTAPALATVVQGQTVLVSTRAAPLSRDLRIVIDPPTAEFWLDSVPIGRGVWHGRVPVGPHVIEAREAGYFAGSLKVEVTTETAGDLALALKVNPEHPRWAKKDESVMYAEVFGGPAFTGSLHSAAENDCDAGKCTLDDPVLGALIGARGGYMFPFHLAFEISAGYLTLSTHVVRAQEHQFPAPSKTVNASFNYDDHLHVAGPFMTIGIAYRLFLERFEIAGRFHVGALLAAAHDDVAASVTATSVIDDVTGSVTPENRTAAANVVGAGSVTRSAVPLILPSIGGRYAFGRFFTGVDLLVAIALVEGRPSSQGETQLPGCDPADPTAPACAPGTNDVKGERMHGRFVLWVPSIVVGYTF